MKKTITILAAITSLLAACTPTPKETDGLCHIHGTVNERFEGKKIFLVPVNGPATMETVDSVVITNGKFAFQSEPGEMKSIRIDFRYRIGVEDLLLVMEPGDVEVVIDTISNGKGTPMNDTLQGWKERTMQYHRCLNPLHLKKKEAEKAGDKATAEAIRAEMERLGKAYKKNSRALADRLKEGPLYEFLDSRFPRSYQKKLPDGTITTVEVEY